jgi:hypothetical protein
MQQALDALDAYSWEQVQVAANALRDRLAQPKTPDVTTDVTPYVIDCPRCGHCCPQPEQEPVAWANKDDLQNFDMRVRTGGGVYHTVPLYTTPPQRPWVGLTMLDMAELRRNGLHAISDKHFRAIEAKIKEKNT